MTLAEKIADVEAKLHALYTGTAFVEVAVGEGAGAHRTVFNRANISALEGYLARLKSELATGVAPARGAVGFWL
jgi:hypothetical protein